jgi:TonB family protein
MKNIFKAVLSLFLIAQIQQSFAQTKPDSIYQEVDNKPHYTGGETALENFITTQTKYPQEALNKKQEGIIEVEFIVSKNGNITDVRCATGKHPELCNEAKRVIAKMPQWIPAKVKDVAVAAKQKIAIGFKLYNKQITYVIIPDEMTASKEVLYHQDMMEEGDPNGVDSEILSRSKSQTDDDVLTFVEQMPEFNGDLYEYLNQSINYPVIAKENKIEGKVIAQFIVEKDGSISNASVLKKMGWGMDEETLRVINNMPNWKPGKQNGKTVRVRYTLPVSFKLK